MFRKVFLCLKQDEVGAIIRGHHARHAWHSLSCKLKNQSQNIKLRISVLLQLPERIQCLFLWTEYDSDRPFIHTEYTRVISLFHHNLCFHPPSLNQYLRARWATWSVLHISREQRVLQAVVLHWLLKTAQTLNQCLIYNLSPLRRTILFCQQIIFDQKTLYPPPCMSVHHSSNRNRK